MKKNDLSFFTENVRTRRRDAGFKSAEDFAAHIDVPYGTYRDIEAGISEGRIEIRIAIAKGLKCSLADLYGTPAADPLPRWANEIADRLQALEVKSVPAESILPRDVLSHWGSVGLTKQTLVLWILTGKDQYKDILGSELAKRLETVLRSLGHSRSRKAR